jgi:hypothetical protein
MATGSNHAEILMRPGKLQNMVVHHCKQHRTMVFGWQERTSILSRGNGNGLPWVARGCDGGDNLARIAMGH